MLQTRLRRWHSRAVSRGECVQGLGDRVRGSGLHLVSHCTGFEEVVEVRHLGQLLGFVAEEIGELLVLLLELVLCFL